MSEITMKIPKVFFIRNFWQSKVLEPWERLERLPKVQLQHSFDVLLPVQRACNEHGLIVLADCVDAKIEPGRASVTVRLTVADSETGESLSDSSWVRRRFQLQRQPPQW